MITEIKTIKSARLLRITGSQGQQSEITASALRSAALDSTSRRERMEYGQVAVANDIRITAVNAMGSTGVNIQFSDGHHRAIFPYKYLCKLAFGSDN